MPLAREVVVSLWASARDAPETPTTHGHRHLLEHLMARGSDGLLDRRLESEGIVMSAQTFRFAMHFQFRCPVGKEGLAFREIAGLLRPFETTKERIAGEVEVMRHEFALREEPDALAAAAWRVAFAERGLDSWGTISALAGASPDALRSLHAAHFADRNLALVIAGPVDLDDASAKAVALLGTAPRAGPRTPATTLEGAAGRGEDAASLGEARGALVTGFDEPATFWTLSAGLALATEIPRSFVSFVPSREPGLVTLGRDDQRHGVGAKVDGLTQNDEARLFRIGWNMGQTWFEQQLSSPAGVAYLRGLYSVQNPAARPEDSLRALRGMTFEQFKQGLRAFGQEAAVTVVGVGR